MNVYLKVKICTLAAESRIIRKMKKRQRKPETKIALNEHRVHHVRKHARASLIAYAFLRGREYNQLEAFCYQKPDWKLVEQNINRFRPIEADPREVAQKFAEWKDRGIEAQSEHPIRIVRDAEEKVAAAVGAIA